MNTQSRGLESVGSVPLLLPLSDSAVVSHLKRCQKIAVDHSGPLFREYLAVLEDKLTELSQTAHSNQEAGDFTIARQLFRQKGSEMERYFSGYVAEAYVKFRKGELSTSFESPLDDHADLALIEDRDLNEQIVLSSLCQRANAFFAEDLWALHQRFAILNGGRDVAEANNPAAPVQFCNALRRATKLVSISPKAASAAFKSFEKKMLVLVERVTRETNHYLQQQGLLPNLKQGQQNVKGNGPAPMTEQGAPSSAQNQNNLVHSIRQLQAQLNAISVDARAYYNDVVTAHELLGVLQSLQTPNIPILTDQAVDTIKPADIERSLRELRESLQKDEKKGLDPKDDQTIDLVGMLFDYMLKDENLPDSVKAILSYLHTPFLKVAFANPNFFEQPDHPARELLNNLANAGARWVSIDGKSQYDILNKIRDVVDFVLKNFEKDIRPITEAVLDFSQYTKGIIRRQELMEKRALEKVKGEEKLREVKLRVNDEIRSRIDNKELPSVVLLFLLQPWSDYLSFCLLRFGDQSKNWRDAVSVVDNLIWCLGPKKMAEDIARQNTLRPSIVEAIGKGFATIGFDKDKGKHVSDSISSLIGLASQRIKIEPASAEDASKLKRLADEKSGLASQPTQDEYSEAEREMVEKLKLIEFGTWFEFADGKRLKVAWYNKRTSHYMLVDQNGKRAAMMSGLDMARQLLSKRTKIIAGSSKPFFERALESTYSKLNERIGERQGKK